jgi:hypothetical protein
LESEQDAPFSVPLFRFDGVFGFHVKFINLRLPHMGLNLSGPNFEPSLSPASLVLVRLGAQDAHEDGFVITTTQPAGRFAVKLVRCHHRVGIEERMTD